MINRIKCNVCVLLAAAVCFALGACSGEEGDSMPQVPANSDALCAITPHAVEINQVDVSTTPITRSATGEPKQKATYAENLGHNFSAEATLEAEPQGAQTRAEASLVAGAQYRIVMYDGSGTIVGNVVYKQGRADVVSGDAIKLRAGRYRLFAYTFNNASAIRGLNADNKNVTINSGEDFMTYTNTAFTISSTDYSSGKVLNISFTRQCTRLKVTVKADGYDATNTITDASMTVSNVFGSGSKWNGYTNTDAATLASVAGTASLTKATGNASSVDCGPAANNPYLITSPCSNQSINISGLSVTIQGAGTKTPATFQLFAPVTFAKGGSYQLTMTIYNSYVLTRTNPVTIEDVKWARTNLQQLEDGHTAPVSFTANPWDDGSHWSWGTRDAADLRHLAGSVKWDNATPGHINQDPCRSLGSGWRLPNLFDMNTLENNPAPQGTRVRINGSIDVIGDKGWDPYAKGVVIINGNQVLFLPAAGSRVYYDMIHEQGISGNYWSYSNSPSSPSSSTPNAWSLECRSNYFTMVNYPRANGCSLRCVQD